MENEKWNQTYRRETHLIHVRLLILTNLQFVNEFSGIKIKQTWRGSTLKISNCFAETSIVRRQILCIWQSSGNFKYPVIKTCSLCCYLYLTSKQKSEADFPSHESLAINWSFCFFPTKLSQLLKNITQSCRSYLANVGLFAINK